MIHSNTRAYWGKPVPPIKRYSMKADFPSQFCKNHTLWNVTVLCKHGKHAKMSAHTHTLTCTTIQRWKIPDFPSDQVPVLTGDRSTWLYQWCFSLRWRETSLSHTRTHTNSMYRNTLTGQPLSHTPTLQSSLNVRPWERGFILEQFSVFTPFITTSLWHTHRHMLMLHPEGQTLALVCAEHENTATLEHLWSDISFYVFAKLNQMSGTDPVFVIIDDGRLCQTKLAGLPWTSWTIFNWRNWP